MPQECPDPNFRIVWYSLSSVLFSRTENVFILRRFNASCPEEEITLRRKMGEGGEGRRSKVPRR